MERLARRLSAIVAAQAGAEAIIVCDYPITALAVAFPRLCWLRLNKLSISAKRNAALSRARGDILAFTDDDCLPQLDWLQKGLCALKDNPSWSGVEGSTTVGGGFAQSGPLSDYRRLERSGGYRTNNIFYRTRAVLQAGCFDERFSVQREDIDLAFSIQEHGGIIGHDPRVRVEHALRGAEPWDLLKNCWNRRFDPLLIRKHPKRYRSVIRTPFPGTIATLLGLSMSVPLCAGRHRRLLIIALSIQLGAVIVLAIRRLWGSRFTVLDIGAATLSFALAPAVLTAALVWGSMRYRRLLIF
jgi:glycosyltransferase involved in cell wall biosynthesis